MKNQSESWKSPGNLFLKKGMNPEISKMLGLSTDTVRDLLVFFFTSGQF